MDNQKIGVAKREIKKGITIAIGFGENGVIVKSSPDIKFSPWGKNKDFYNGKI